MFTVSDANNEVFNNLIKGLTNSDSLPYEINQQSEQFSGINSQFSFSATWVGKAEQARQSSLISKFFDASSSDEKLSIAEDIVRSMLREVASTLKDSSLKEKYLDQSLSQRELVKVLEYCDTPSLLKFTQKVCELSDGSSEVKDFISSKLDNVFRVSTEGEKASILSMLLKSEIPHKGTFIAEGLRSAETHKELAKLIKVTGQDKLIDLKEIELTNIVAQGIFGETLRKVRLPKSPSRNADATVHQKFVKELDTTLLKAKDSLRSNAALSETRYGREYLATIEYFRNEASNSLLIDAELLIARISISLQYGVKLTNSVSGEYGTGSKWSLEEVKDTEKALKKLPEGILISTPLLNEIQRVQYIGRYVLGARYSNGIIRIADYAIKHPVIEQYYPNAGSLQVVLVHEIGHGVQLGDSYGSIDFTGGESHIDDGDDRMDFDEFMQVSGWRAINPNRWESTKDDKVIIDGKEYDTRVQVELDNKKVILIPFYDELYAIDADAKFSFRDYAKTNPWEDYAEAFTEYFLNAKRLFEYAPKKYKFLEEEFGVYGENPAP